MDSYDVKLASTVTAIGRAFNSIVWIRNGDNGSIVAEVMALSFNSIVWILEFGSEFSDFSESYYFQFHCMDSFLL